jgi:hypothetical protein
MDPDSGEFKRLILQIETTLLDTARLRTLLTDEDDVASVNERKVGQVAHPSAQEHVQPLDANDRRD